MKTKYFKNLPFNKLYQCSFCLIIKMGIGFIFLIFQTTSYAQLSKAIDKYYDYAMSLQQKGFYAQADDVLSAGITKIPQAIALYYARGNLRNEYLHKYFEAAMDYTAVIKLDLKNNPKALWRRGDCLYALGNYQLSIADYTYCLKLLPGYDKVYMKRARAYAKLGMIEEAKSDLQSVLKSNPKYEQEVRALLEKILSGHNDY